MFSTQLAAAHAMSPQELCTYIGVQQYEPIEHLMQSLQTVVEKEKYAEHEFDFLSMAALIFLKMKDEMEQVIRNDKIILFPLIGRLANQDLQDLVHMPIKMIRKKNQKIIALMERLRAVGNNYIAKPEWTEDARIFFEQLFMLHELIELSIYLKENILLPAMVERYSGELE